MPEIELRRFTPADQPAVRALVLAGLAEHWGASLDTALNPDLDDIATSYAHGITMVAVGDGHIVGTGTIVPRAPDTVEIVRMSVDVAWRSRGVGRQVLEALVAGAVDADQAGELRRVVLETTADWQRTVAFYERSGFVITHHDDGPFGRDAWFERVL